MHLALAAERTKTIEFGTAVLVPTQRSVLTMASSIATIARISGGRLRTCFGTGFTAQFAVGQRPISLDALSDYVVALRRLLQGETATIEGRRVRMLQASDFAMKRPIKVLFGLAFSGAEVMR